MPRIRVVTRGDDSGSCHSANRAIADAFRHGVLRNTSIMVPAPVFKEAAQMYRDMNGLCIGLHGTITDEWNTDRWGPVLGAEAVPSLVRPDGTFFKSTQLLRDNKPDYDEVLAELKAQLDLARSEGLDIKYIDTHMAFSWFDGLESRLHSFAESEGLIYRPKGLSRLAKIEGDFADPVARLIATLDAAEPDRTYMVVAHPCYDEGDIQQMTYGDYQPGEIARERDWERRLFMDDRIVEYFHKNDVQPVTFAELDGFPFSR